MQLFQKKRFLSATKWLTKWVWKRLWQRFHFCFLQLQIKYRELFRGKRRKETEVFQGPKTRVNLGMEGRALLWTGHFFLCWDACNYHYIIMLYLEIGISFHHVGVWKKGNKTRKIRALMENDELINRDNCIIKKIFCL